MLIDHVRIVDETQDHWGSIILEGNRIAEVLHRPLNQEEKERDPLWIDGKGKALLPSFIDLHVHMREPGFEYKEDLRSGLSAALAGGFTHVCAMANTDPVMDTKEKIERNLEKAKNLDLAHLIQVGAVTKNFEDDAHALVDFAELRPLTPIFSNDGKNLGQPEAIARALKASAEWDFILSCHCEPETEMVKKALEIAKQVGGNLHICHISREETVKAIRKAKEAGVKVTCEATPHHLFAWDDPYRVAPPMGSKEDVLALLQGIRDGVVDVLATDHAPHSEEDKEKGAPGISNIEVAFSMYYTVFTEHGIPLQRLSRMLSGRPGEMLGLNSGKIQVGQEANLVLVDLEEAQTIQPQTFLSKGKNNPFAGQRIQGRIITTIKGGVIKYDHGQIVR